MRWTVRAKISLVFVIVISVVMFGYTFASVIFVKAQIYGYLSELGDSTVLRLTKNTVTALETKDKKLVMEILRRGNRG